MFIQLIEGRTSNPEGIHRQIDLWERELQPGADGYLGSAGGCTADGMCVLVARFENRDAAMRNSNRPEQSAWWSETKQFFDGPVSFHDTDDVHVMAHGPMDEAQFIQVMEGHVTDRRRAGQLEDEADPVLAQARPDLLGSYTAYFEDGDFADVAFFTNEAEARQAESMEMPPEMAERFGEWEQLMKVDRYLDIREPWLTGT